MPVSKSNGHQSIGGCCFRQVQSLEIGIEIELCITYSTRMSSVLLKLKLILIKRTGVRENI